MKRAVFTLWLLLAAVAATAQSEPTPPEFEYSDLQRLTPEDYIDMQLPPLHVLMENARHAPQVGYYESNREIEERELKTVRRNWMRNFKLNANYNYGSSDIYNQNYQDNSNQIWTTTTTGREQSWWNVGASFSLPIDEIFNRRNKIKQQKRRSILYSILGMIPRFLVFVLPFVCSLVTSTLVLPQFGQTIFFSPFPYFF